MIEFKIIKLQTETEVPAMAYILKKGSQYCYLNANGRVCKTENIGQAKRFTKEEATAVLNRSTKKLAGYELFDLDADQKTKAMSKVKRKNFSSEDRITVYNQYEGKCGICGRFVPFDEFTIDHMIPLSKGGTNELKNLQCACKTCNALKQDSLSEDFMKKLEEIVLYQMKTNYNEAFCNKINTIRNQRKKVRIKGNLRMLRQRFQSRKKL
jgi:hypothetical protein